MLSTLRSIWSWIATITLIVLWLPLVALVRLFDRDPALYATGRWFRRLGPAMTRANSTWRIRISGETISDPRRPYVVVSNHQSLADIPVLSNLPWEMKWVAKAELFRVPFVGWMMSLSGDIPVERGTAVSGAKALVKARQYLRERCSVIFFPEGTRSPDGRVSEFSEGAFRLAIKEKLPILPLALDGTERALPKNSWRFGEPCIIRVAVLPPVETASLTPGDADALRDRVRGMIVDRIAEWRGVAPEVVDVAPARPRLATGAAASRSESGD